MYSVLKSKRCHFEIPQNPFQNESDFKSKESTGLLYNSQNIVSSCFLDDVFILFLFNSGRYIIANSSGFHDQSSLNGKTSNKKSKKSKTVESQIMYDGNILKEIQKQPYSESFDQKKSNYPSQKLLSKSSMKFIEESFSKTIFTDCKRIRTNECIIITRFSKNVYWLKVAKHSGLGGNETSIQIKTSIIELPGTALSQILNVDKIQMTQNMTILTDLIQFNSSSQKSHQQKGLSSYQVGSFCIKNEIVEDKMIYITCYTRIPQNIRQKYSQIFFQASRQFQYSKSTKISFPSFIVTKLQFPIPVNQVNSNFIIQASDKFNNQIAIYKQSQENDTQWEIKLYRFGFSQIKGEQIVKNFTQSMVKNSQNHMFYSNQNILAIENNFNNLQPLVIVLPQQFTSSIHLQQFLRVDKHHEKSSNQAEYLIISVNQTFVENQLNQPNIPQNYRTVRVNGQLFHIDENGILRQPQNITNNNNCWIHSCRLTFHQNSQNFTQHIQRLHNFSIDSLSFLKVINVNYELGLMYVLSLAHQSVDGQLYENKIDLVNIKNGQIVEKGYCSLKNYSFSPNQKYILDTPETFSQESDYFYHIRILFDKKSLYLFMVENANQYFQQYKDANFIQTVLNLL